MKSMREIEIAELEWKQERFGVDSFELRSGEDLVGLMYWTKWFSDEALAKSADRAWHLDRPGFFRDRVVVCERSTKEETAHFDFGWFGEGMLELTDGRRYQWFRTKAFCNYWALASDQDEVLFEIRHGMRWFKQEARVVVHQAGLAEEDLTLLLMIGWYLVCMAIQDAAAGAAAATTAAVS